MYSLSMNNYQSSTSDAFQLLKQDTDFLDVTLACENGNQVKAHKVVLSSFSSVFQSILKNNHHPHPLLYLTGIEEQDIVNILDFIYLGEIKVAQSHVQKFLNIADKFKINGLTDVDKKKKNAENISEMDDKSLECNSYEDDDDENEVVEEYVASVPRIETLESNNIKSEDDIKNLEKEYTRSVGMVVDEEISELDPSPSIDQRRKFNCVECDYRATQSSSLKVHVLAKHRGIRFPCQVCDFTGSTKANTKVHMRNKHSL